jgi:uncharacterized protein (TIGR00369 family)
VNDTEPLDLAAARRVLAAQPFSRLLGAELTAFGDGRAELRVPLPEQHRQQDGVAHGGVLSYAADNVLTFAAGATVGPAVWTAGFTIDYLAPATGPTLIARGEVVLAGRRLVTVRANLYDLSHDGTEHLTAVAQGTIARR